MKKKGLSIRQTLILFVFIILMSSTLITSAFYLLMVQWEWARPLMYSRIVTILWVAGFSMIVGMVIASPVVILMDRSLYEGFNSVIGIVSVVTLALGVFVAFKLGGDPEPVKE